MTSEGDLPSVQLPQQDGEAVHVTPGARRAPPQELRSLNVWKILVLRSTFLAPIGAQEMLMSVRPVQVCLEQSIFIILAQIFKQSVRNKSAVSGHSVSTQ